MKQRFPILLTASALLFLAPLAQGQQYPADNSGKNARDAHPHAVTAGKQSNRPADVTITREIRKAVVADKSLSTNAHNVKIITAGGVVTLRGPVGSAAERDTIVATAQHVAGVTRINNQLEVAGHSAADNPR